MRLGQQELVAGLGLFALETSSIAVVLNEICRVAALGLQTEFAKVLRPRAEADNLLVVAGVGWRPGVVGHATLGSHMDSPAGFALHSGQPVLSNDLGSEGRFRIPTLLVEHGVQSAINVPIGVAGREPFGVLEVDSTARHDFVAADIVFLRSLGNVLAAAVIRFDMDQAAVGREALARQVFESNPDCVKVLDLEGRLLEVNVNGLLALEAAGPDGLVGTMWPDWWPDESRPVVRAAVADAGRGAVSRFTAATCNRAGAAVWWDALVAPVLNEDGQPFRLVAISRNVTDRMEGERAKDALLRDKDLLMQEVHHRVKNSLQLVRTLLQLQGRSASDETRAQLDEAARRIMTIGAVHQRLYEGGSVVETDAAAYLEALVADIRTMLADSAGGREIVLQAEPMTLTADQMTPLGLVVSELVTNALKYGESRVKVGLRRVPAGLEIVVEDGGRGFPEAFDPGRKSGLGMRLIAALAKGEGMNAIKVDRDVPHSRIMVMMTL